MLQILIYINRPIHHYVSFAMFNIICKHVTFHLVLENILAEVGSTIGLKLKYIFLILAAKNSMRLIYHTLISHKIFSYVIITCT